MVIPAGDRNELAVYLNAIPGCDALAAENTELLLLVTETVTRGEEQALRDRLASVRGIRNLTLTFGDIDPDTDEADPLASVKKSPRALAGR